MQNSMLLLTFFIFDWKYPFLANLVQKIKFASLTLSAPGEEGHIVPLRVGFLTPVF